MKCRFWFIAALLYLPMQVSAAPIYVFKDKSGAIRFTNKAPPSGVTAKVFTAKRNGFSWYRATGIRSEKLFWQKYSTVIESASRKAGVDPHLVRAVIHCESAFNSNAVSRAGAVGLMQLMPGTAKDRGVKDSYDPESNITGGVKHLALLLKTYNGNVDHALAAYNAGEEAVRKYGGIPPYSETQNYVRRVKDFWRRYRAGHGS